MSMIRPPAVAGSFYPRDPVELDHQLDGFLAQAMAPATEPVPKAIIVPHAGYIYSGPIAASAYARLQPAQGRIKRVILIGPSHRVAFRGMALTQADEWSTPLGNLPIDRAAFTLLDGLPLVGFLEQAHGPEHSLEVHLPFIVKTLGIVPIVPIVMGDTPCPAVADVLDA